MSEGKRFGNSDGKRSIAFKTVAMGCVRPGQAFCHSGHPARPDNPLVGQGVECLNESKATKVQLVGLNILDC